MEEEDIVEEEEVELTDLDRIMSGEAVDIIPGTTITLQIEQDENCTWEVDVTGDYISLTSDVLQQTVEAAWLGTNEGTRVLYF